MLVSTLDVVLPSYRYLNECSCSEKSKKFISKLVLSIVSKMAALKYGGAFGIGEKVGHTTKTLDCTSIQPKNMCAKNCQ